LELYESTRGGEEALFGSLVPPKPTAKELSSYLSNSFRGWLLGNSEELRAMEKSRAIFR
jgi:hypothetical protein